MAPWLPLSMMVMASIPAAPPVKGTTNGPLVWLVVTSVQDHVNVPATSATTRK